MKNTNLRVYEKTMTTKELAETLGVDVRTVNGTVERLLENTFQKFGAIKTVSNGGRPTKVFTEQQATLIKQEIQKHHNLASRQIDEVTTDYKTEFTLISNENGNCVSARELHQRLEITDRFSRWFESYFKYGFCENSDFWCVKTSTHQNQYGGTKSKCS